MPQCKFSVCGSLVQYLCLRISASGSFRTTCARSLQSHWCKNFIAGSLQQDRVGPLAQDLCIRISCARSPCQDLRIRILYIRLLDNPLPDYKSVICHCPSNARSTQSENATLPVPCAMDTRDLRRGLCLEIRKRNFTSIPCDRHAQSPHKVALGNQKMQLYQHSVRWTRTIFAEGCAWKSESATLPAFCGQKVGMCVSFEGLRFTWQAKAIRTMDALFWGRRARFLRRVAFVKLELEDAFAWPVQHFVWPWVMISWHAQYFWNMFSTCEPSAEIVRVHETLRLPRFLTRVRFLWPARGHPVKRPLRNCKFPDGYFVRACADGSNMDSPNGIAAQTKPADQSEHLNEHPAFTLTVRTLSAKHCLGKNIPSGNDFGKFHGKLTDPFRVPNELCF